MPGSPGRAMDPVAMVLAAADHPHADPLSITPTLATLDADGVPTGYLTGRDLLQAIQAVHLQVLASLKDDRLDRVQAIGDWRISHRLIRCLEDALVDPLMERLTDERALRLHFCYTAILRSGQDPPRSVWWTPKLLALLQEHNPGHPIRDLRFITSALNTSYYSFVVRIPRRLLPLRFGSDDHPADGYLSALKALTRTMLSAWLAPAEGELSPRS